MLADRKLVLCRRRFLGFVAASRNLDLIEMSGQETKNPPAEVGGCSVMQNRCVLKRGHHSSPT